MTEDLSKYFDGNFIREVDKKVRISCGRKKADRQVELKCLCCGSHFIATLANAKRVRQKYCSHTCSGIVAQGVEGGNDNHPLYPRWLSMNQRCNNKTSDNYINYGARGICILDDIKSFTDYASVVSNLPNCPDLTNIGEMTVDRIDNSKNYTATNLRWASKSLQSANQRNRKHAKSNYRGVVWLSIHNRWKSTVVWEGVEYAGTVHLTEEEALAARNLAIKIHSLPHPIQDVG